MKALHREIDAFLSPSADGSADGGTIVFPSEIAAEFWRHAVLRAGSRQAVRADRLISWDTFKERAFEIREELLPVNRTIRTVFAEQIVRENAAEPFLHALIAPEHASSGAAFTGAIVQVLPGLSDALAAIGPTAPTLRLSNLRTDLLQIHGRYKTFLGRHGFFEPRWLKAEHRFRGGTWLLVMPELAEDHPEFRRALAGVPVFEPAARDSHLEVYPDTRTELRAVLGAIARLLDDGAEPQQILLTVCDLEQLADRVRQEAEKLAVPLDLRIGRPLSDSGVGRFIRDIGEVVGSGFSIDPVRRVLLNMGVPWKDRFVGAGLVISGIEAGVLGGTSAPDARWRRMGRRPLRAGDPAEAPERERRLFATVRTIFPRVSGARSFGELRRALNELLGRLVDRTGWSPANERVLERCQDELRALADMETVTGLRVDNPYRFWVDRLGERLYVSQASSAGVTVLPYRVGAGTSPVHHFVMNACQAGTSVMVRTFPFLSDAEREHLGGAAADRDLSRRFLEAYAASGEQVAFSASRTTFEGPALPAGVFVARGAARDVESGRIREMRAGDSYLCEESFSEPAVPFAVQADGAASYAAAAGRGTVDFTQSAIQDAEVRDLVVRRLRSRSDPDLLRLSASQIDSFRTCPFGYLLTHGLGLEELTLSPEPDDARELGRLYHDILASFFAKLAGERTAFDSTRLESYVAELEALADELYRERRGMVPDIVYGANRSTFSRIVRRFLSNDADLIDRHVPLLVEGRREDRELFRGVLLVARVDRVTQAEDGTVTLVDYKKSRLPRRVEINAGSDQPVGAALTTEERAKEVEVLGSVQIPLYVRLLEEGGPMVSAAGYYSLEGGDYLSVFGAAPGDRSASCMSRERMDEILDLMNDIVASIVRRITGGDFSCGSRCAHCSMQGICRTGFAVR